jgi:hypothetical protein
LPEKRNSGRKYLYQNASGMQLKLIISWSAIVSAGSWPILSLRFASGSSFLGFLRQINRFSAFFDHILMIAVKKHQENFFRVFA